MDKPFWGKLKTPNNGGLTAQMAWNYVRDYSTMATIQLSRIQEDYDVLSLKPQIRREIEIDLGVSDVEAAGIEEMQAVRATADAHFYLNCWRIVALNAYRIAIAIDHAQLHQFIKDQNCSVNRTGTGLYFGDAIPSVTLGWYANGRDQFEHVDERIYGGKHWDKIKTDPERIIDLTGEPKENAEYFPAPFFNGTHMVVGNNLWEITPRTHRQLLRAVNQLEGIGRSILAEQS